MQKTWRYTIKVFGGMEDTSKEFRASFISVVGGDNERYCA